jgi:uncharacterized protein YktB (UPF0637 family)
MNEKIKSFLSLNTWVPIGSIAVIIATVLYVVDIRYTANEARAMSEANNIALKTTTERVEDLEKAFISIEQSLKNTDRNTETALRILESIQFNP